MISTHPFQVLNRVTPEVTQVINHYGDEVLKIFTV